jgi:hypothetical protein
MAAGGVAAGGVAAGAGGRTGLIADPQAAQNFCSAASRGVPQLAQKPNPNDMSIPL